LSGRTYVSRLERGIENLTVTVLAKIAEAPRAEITELFAVAAAAEKPPATLPSGRKRQRAK